jgi:hypothetical protein
VMLQKHHIYGDIHGSDGGLKVVCPSG